MRTLFMETKDVKTQEEIFQKVYELVKNGKCMEEFSRGEITICKCTGEGKHDVILSVDDRVKATLLVQTFSTDDTGNKCPSVRVDSEVFSDGLPVPNDVRMVLEWEEDRK